MQIKATKVYSSLSIVRVIKSRRMRWAGNVARVGERRGIYKDLVGGDLKERDHLGDPRVDVRRIRRWVFRKCGGRHGLD
jgi:hypothetical protein